MNLTTFPFPPRKKKVHKNEYKIRVYYMFGDADGYTDNKVYVHKNDTNLEEFLRCIWMCVKAFPNGRGGGDEYTWIPNYLKYFGYNSVDSTIQIDHPSDPSSDDSATIEDFSITYFDENGIELDIDNDEIFDENEQKEMLELLRTSKSNKNRS